MEPNSNNIDDHEYALARKEIKKGPGHQNFDFIFDPSITLEEDLMRRDFTVNALCMDEHGVVIDLVHGVKDLELKILRHVSEHFSEDPLRVLRAAKFAARLSFDIAIETMELMQQMTQRGELKHLSMERVKAEIDDALISNKFEIFADVLKQVGYWAELKNDFPLVEELNTITQLEHKWVYSGVIAYPYLGNAERRDSNQVIIDWKNKYRLTNQTENLTLMLRYFIYLKDNNLYQSDKVLELLTYFQDGKNSVAINQFAAIIDDLTKVIDLTPHWSKFLKLLGHFKKLSWTENNLNAEQVKIKKLQWLSQFTF